MEGRHGLTELYRPKCEAVADIVFVHGLFGHPYKTWSARKNRSKSPQPAPQTETRLSSPQLINPSEKVEDPTLHRDRSSEDGDKPSIYGYKPWPKTLLPERVPNTRIFTWGYDADVNGLFSYASQNSISQHANNLLSDLSDLRRSPKDREVPIIFVVHSLGGIVVKDALNQSSSKAGTRLKHIAPATFGIFFLGTPHRGSKSASIGKILNQISIVASKCPNLRLLQGLERNSEILDSIGDGFRQTMLKHKLRLCSFREEMETRKYLFLNTMVVDSDSAKLGDGKEELGSIPSDHSNMTKFESSGDIGFRRISSTLLRWVEEIEAGGDVNRDYYAAFLNSLDTSEARKRIGEVHNAQEKTFHWLFDTSIVTFGDWLQNSNMVERPIYWISGKPGSGKSTLMKFALYDKRTSALLAKVSTSKWTIAAFFFHDRGSEVQKSLEGMLQEILHSILNQIPALSACITSFYLKLVKSQRTNSPKWDMQTLREALLRIAQQRRVNVQLCLFIDALDEHSGDNEYLAQLLKDIAKNSDGEVVKLKICIASRSWTVFTQHFGNCPGLAIHDFTATDIQLYIENRFAVDHLGLQLSLDDIQLRKTSNQVADKALGVFIWVRLVMDLIIKDIRDGTTFLALEDRITNMPKELEDLYADTVRRIEDEYRSEAYVMFQVALCTLSPLTPREFLFIIDSSFTHYNSTRSLSSLAMQMRTLSSRGGGLLEVVYSPSSDEQLEGKTGVYHVQFIHQTVKTYVRKHKSDISKVLHYQGSGYLFLLEAACAVQIGVSLGEHFRGYFKGMEHVFVYAKIYEESSPDEEIDRYIKLFRGFSDHLTKDRVASWCSWNVRLFDYVKILQNPLDIFFCLIVAANLNIFVSKTEIFSKNRRSEIMCPLKIAALGLNIVPSIYVDQSRMIETITKAGYPVDHVSRAHIMGITDVPLFLSVPDPSKSCSSTPLGALFVQEHNTTTGEELALRRAKVLLDAGASPDAKIYLVTSHSDIVHIFNILEYCVRFGTAPFLRLLLQYCAESGVLNQRLNVFDYANIRGDPDIIQALKDHGYNDEPRPPLSAVQCAFAVASHICVAPVGAPACHMFRSFRRAIGIDLD